MTINPLRSCAPFRRMLCAALFLFCASAFAPVWAATGGMVLLTEPTSTRAIALESTTLLGEPFRLTTPVPFSADTRTRLIFFAMNLDLLAGESAKAFSADAEDAAKNSYALTVEDVRPVPGFEWMSAITLRLADNMGDPGDVLVRINLHGVASNRVRVAIGHKGGGPPDDAGSVPTPAPAVAPQPTPTPTPNPYTGAATTPDTVRFLEQATWGPTNAEVARVQAMGFRAFLNEQFNAPLANPAKGSDYPDLAFPLDDQNQQCPAGTMQAECNRDNYTMYPLQRTFFSNALYGQGQLRQRVAFALHQIFVVSGRDLNRPSWMTVYLQALDRNAFGNFRTLLQDITLNPSMGEYLDMRLSTRTSPNENFAREILQLFSIGVDELNTDGTPRLDTQGNRIPSYTQNTVNEFTRVFTGWNLSTAIAAGITNYRDPMVPRTGTNHDTGTKTLLNGTVLPAGQNATQDLNAALDNIFNHPNVGPFIGKQLIQHLVTSNPSPAYVERVASAFNNNCAGLYPENCTGARGDMKATVRAVLLDPEARGDAKTAPNYGKLREPVQYISNVLRAFNAKSFDKTTTSDGVLGLRSSTDFPNSMDQPVFMPATVFSYYTPDYEVPGARILGPAFGILSTSTTLRRINFVNSIVYSGVSPSTTSTDRPRGTSLDLSALEALAANPEQLLSALDSLLMHGTMPTGSQMRTSIINAISQIPTTDSAFARKRTQMAVYLVATSSQYQVQR
ncbi:MAG TPA: DUF1800 domain-containing protein [Pyrinomonadaceae bacterium]